MAIPAPPSISLPDGCVVMRGGNSATAGRLGLSSSAVCPSGGPCRAILASFRISCPGEALGSCAVNCSRNHQSDQQRAFALKTQLPKAPEQI